MICFQILILLLNLINSYEITNQTEIKENNSTLKSATLTCYYSGQPYYYVHSQCAVCEDVDFSCKTCNSGYNKIIRWWSPNNQLVVCSEDDDIDTIKCTGGCASAD